jgi:uncharacterized protein (TIRG00374 family)
MTVTDMKKRSLLPFVGIAIFFLIILNVDFPTVLSVIGGTDVYMFVLATSLSVPIVALKAFKWRVIVNSYNARFPFVSAIEGWLIGFSLGIITPGRVGEVSRAYYLKQKSGMSFGKSVTTVFIDRVIDISVLFLFAIMGIAFFINTFSGLMGIEAYFAAFFAAFLVLVVLVTRKGIITAVAGPVFRRLAPPRYKQRLNSAYHDFYQGFSDLSKSRVTLSILVSFAIWIISILQYYTLSSSLGIDINILFFFSIVPVVALLDALPISFSGIGTRDAGLVFFFSLLSISSEPAISLSLLVLASTYLVTGLAGIVLWLRNPMKTGSME